MSSKKIVYALILVLLAGLFITNPDKDQFDTYKRTQLAKELSKRLGRPVDKDNFLFKMTAGLLDGVLKTQVVRSNYGVFSVFSVNAAILGSSDHVVADETFIGIAGHFIPLKSKPQKDQAGQQ